MKPSGRNGSGPTVLNVKFTGDLQRHETKLEQIWGGALWHAGFSPLSLAILVKAVILAVCEK